jgi:hypothetical protein
MDASIMFEKTQFPKKKVKFIAQMMATAFNDYPMIKYLFPNPKTRLQRSSIYFHALLNYGRRYGKIYLTSINYEGVCVVLPSKMAHFPTWPVIRSGIASKFGILGPGFLSRLSKQENCQYNIYKKHTAFPHNYLILITINPQSQGQGFAGQLLRLINQDHDENHMPCYLETYTPKNVEIYKRFGYTVVEESCIPKTEHKFWGMLRQPN